MGGQINSHRDLVVWQKSIKFGLTVYGVAAFLPDHERFGLASQLRRGAVSVASNIAEGYGRGSRQDYLRFLCIARGALFELDTQLRFAVALKYVSEEQFERVREELEECSRLLAGLIRSLE